MPYTNIFSFIFENFLIWIIFGIAIGFIVYLIDRRAVKDLENTLFFGVLGALTGGYVAQFTFKNVLKNLVNFQTLTLALIGGFVLSYIGVLITTKFIKRRGYG
ncbi:MAG: hypothetical protein COU27_01990 [Candidatus Levybacteria bacterium CG10_big_fil_rev_8_21_14_0_10_36_7]|nr:MAG: hypothetical protein COU27_01990 [Candidatus Levybacteria bacterium CG10_big_fil_rev_8_21_14_0_10_36_7]